jgi:hypothetical protein
MAQGVDWIFEIPIRLPPGGPSIAVSPDPSPSECSFYGKSGSLTVNKLARIFIGVVVTLALLAGLAWANRVELMLSAIGFAIKLHGENDRQGPVRSRGCRRRVHRLVELVV